MNDVLLYALALLAGGGWGLALRLDRDLRELQEIAGRLVLGNIIEEARREAEKPSCGA